LETRTRQNDNVESVDKSRDGHPKASFGLLNTEDWTYGNVRVAHDIQRAAAETRKAGLPGYLAK